MRSDKPHRKILASYAMAAILFAGIATDGVAQPRPRELPPLLATVSDETGVLGEQEGRQLSRTLDRIAEEHGVPVVLVVAEAIGPEPIADYADRLARRWARERGLDIERTIFIILALQDREMSVMPGRALGLEAKLARPGLTEGIGPYFRNDRYFEGLTVLVDRVHAVLHDRPGEH